MQPRLGLPILRFLRPLLKSASPVEKQSDFSRSCGGRDFRKQSPVARALEPRRRTHRFCGDLNRTKRKATSFSKEVPALSPEVKWRTVLPPGLRAHPLPASPQRLVASLSPAERHVCSERLLHTSRVFIRSLPRVRSGRAGNKENARTWRRSEGGLAGPPLARGPPEATPRPSGRPTALPSLPPGRRTPRSQLRWKREELSVWAPRPSSRAKARASSPSKGAQRVPAAGRPGGRLRDPRAALVCGPAAGPCPGASFSAGAPAFPCSG